MSGFFRRLPQTFFSVFTGKRLFFHLLAIALTYGMVASGLDWTYFSFFHASFLRSVLFSAALLGGILPLLLPFIVLAIGRARRNARFITAAFALGQAAFLGWLVSSLYKFFTGRPGPEMRGSLELSDVTHVFRFGFYRGGVFWGWPSSHATVAFAMAFALITLFPRKKILGAFAFLYALFIAVGVSMSIHWLSDAVAGALIGTAVGAAVGTSFREKTG
jgi:membrane-associated phospholipid phosphatase